MFGKGKKEKEDDKLKAAVSEAVAQARAEEQQSAAQQVARQIFAAGGQNLSQDSLQTIKEFITSNKNNYVKSRIAHPGHETVLQIMHRWGQVEKVYDMFAPSDEAQTNSYHDKRTINLISKDGLSRAEVVSSIAFAGLGVDEMTARQKERLTEGNRKG